jgi:hypothetical protein
MRNMEEYLVFSREESAKEVAEIADTYCVALDKLVDASVGVYIQIFETKSELTHRMVLHRFLHIIDMADAISITARSGSGVACSQLFRSCLEATITVRYLTMEESKRDQRALALAYSDLMEFEKQQRSTTTCNPLGASVHRRKAESVYRFMPDTNPQKAKGNLGAVRSRMKEATYRDTHAEYERIVDRLSEGKKRKVKKHMVNWYSLYDGPSGLEELAKICGLAHEYDVLYRHTSAPIHGRVLIHSPALQDNEAKLGRVRNPESVETWVSLTENLLYHCLTIMVMHYNPNDKLDMLRWYWQEVRPHLPREMPPLDTSILSDEDKETMEQFVKRMGTSRDSDSEQDED